MKLSLCLMFKHLADDKWLGQEKLPAMIVWKKKNLKKSPSCIRSLDNWLLISTYSHLAHQTRSCWIKRENLHKNEMTVVILKLNDERKKKEILVMYFYCDLVADKNDEKSGKKINIFSPLTSSAEQQLVWPPNHWRESNICSKLKFLDQNLNRHHSPPALKPPPRFLPVKKKSNQNTRRKFVSDCDQYPLIFVSVFLILLSFKTTPSLFFL